MFICIIVRMKGRLLVSKFWTRLFSFGKADAITIFPFILLRRKGMKSDEILLNHERIHLSQALELFIFPFYIWYLFEFFVRLIQYCSFDLAYQNISFEREAFANQMDKDYLKKRKLWDFLKYIAI